MRVRPLSRPKPCGWNMRPFIAAGSGCCPSSFQLSSGNWIALPRAALSERLRGTSGSPSSCCEASSAGCGARVRAVRAKWAVCFTELRFSWGRNKQNSCRRAVASHVRNPTPTHPPFYSWWSSCSSNLWLQGRGHSAFTPGAEVTQVSSQRSSGWNLTLTAH